MTTMTKSLEQMLAERLVDRGAAEAHKANTNRSLVFPIACMRSKTARSV